MNRSKKTKITPLRLQAEYLEAIARICKRNKTNTSDAVRLAIMGWDEKERKEEELRHTG